jgi:AcrR family transcriptional regulator
VSPRVPREKRAGSATPRARRTHAERTAETRGRILAAVVECIGELGFQRTTASEIARRAGVTWGAVQHHFGGKDGILLAVLADSFERFAARLSDVETAGLPLEKRVGLFLDRAWEHFGSAHFRSTFEILLSYAGAEGPDREPLWQDEMFRAWNRIWSKFFADGALPRRRTVILQEYTIAALSGLASLQLLGGAKPRLRQPELDLLKQTLVRELGG